MEKTWISPDGRIEKDIITFGVFGLKPTENCECKIKITDTNLDVTNFNESPVTIGDVYSYFGKLLDICLQTMCQGEIAKVTLKMNNEREQFVLELKSFIANGLIYEWDALAKYNLAFNHKSKGVELCKNNNYIAASYRFGKALKLLCSIPVDVEDPPKEVDGIFIKDIYNLKANLYSNLASCFLSNKNYDTVIRLCKKALAIDNRNVKALYRCGTAYYEEHDYEKAVETFNNILNIEPDNKAAINMLRNSEKRLAEANDKVNDIIKKMFVVN